MKRLRLATCTVALGAAIATANANTNATTIQQCDPDFPLCDPGQSCVFANQSYSFCHQEPTTTLQVPEPGAFLLSSANNPLRGKNMFVQRDFQQEIDSSIKLETDPPTLRNLRQMREMGSAIWLDTKANIQKAVAALEEAATMKPSPVVTFIIYNLPNRDCSARASNGEICCEGGNGACNYQGNECSAGLKDYKTNYIDRIADLFSQYESRVPIVAVIEPDSLPNLATNMGNLRCSNGATVQAYKEGIAYAISQFASKCSRCILYLDVAHGGWLGWASNLDKYKQLLLEMHLDFSKIRGFASNVANYQPLGNTLCSSVDRCVGGQNGKDPCCSDPCRLAAQYNYGHNELNYIQFVASKFADVMSPHFLVDTGRNGVANMRQSCSNWCNIRGAGVGHKPDTLTSLPGLIDAYMWLKTPGESDGCTSQLPDTQQCPRFDSMCESVDSVGFQKGEPRAPEAGKWFDYTARQLARNAAMN